MSKTRIGELQSLVARLQTDRNAHVDAITEIDAAFDALGIAVPKTKKRGRKSKKTVAVKPLATKKAKRKKYRLTANDFVLATIKKASAKGATGAQISKAWSVTGRPGDAYNALSTLAKEKKIKREKLKGAQGSVYRVA